MLVKSLGYADRDLRMHREICWNPTAFVILHA